MTNKPYGVIDPNSQHQLWSRWHFGIASAPDKRPGVNEVVTNAQRYFAKLFGTMGRVRCEEQAGHYLLTVEVEGPTVHDPVYRERVQRDFEVQFMEKGFGTQARLVRFIVGVLAGDQQDGKPPTQMLVMPQVNFSAQLHAV